MTDDVTRYRSTRSRIRSASNRPRTTTGRPESRWRTEVSGPLCCSGPTTRCGPGGKPERPARIEAYSAADVTVDGAHRTGVPRALPVVPDVYTSGGRAIRPEDAGRE